jgi:predicted porin
LAVALFGPGTAWAADLRLSLGAEGEWDSNVFRRDTDVESDFVILGIPRIQLLETEGKLTYETSYQFPYQRSIRTDALRSFNHLARISADYHLSDRAEFSFSNRLSYVETLTQDFDDTPNISDDGVAKHVFRNRATLGAEYHFTPRLSSDTAFSQELYYTSQDGRADNQSYSLASGLRHLLTERQTLGGGIQASFQHFNEAEQSACGTILTQPETRTIFVGPYLGWSYQIDEQSEFRATAGPTYVRSEEDAGIDPNTCLPQGSQSDNRIAVFGEVSLNRRWSPTMLSGLSYQRRQDTASGVSGSAILDAVALTHSWQLTERWTLAGRADWTRRESATGVERGIENIDTQRWGAGAVVSYRITRNLTSSLRYQYTKQTSQAETAGRFSDFQAHVVTLGVDYSLDPFEVW